MRSENNLERRINSSMSEAISEPQSEMMGEVNEVEEVMRDEMGEDRGPEEVNSSNIYEVKIEPLSSGFLVTVGCQRVAVESPETLLKALKAYYENPSEFQRNWYKNKNINKLQ
jgi:hypothetical protein